MSERATAMIACSGCGTPAPDGGDVPATWTFQTSERGVTYLCEACARQNIRSIEGRLDDAWW
ncbi:MAG TPA: hypothetical protein VHE83_02595 [Mycobacteriales bacterium]|nr:hypothetical protein [Mycobacteriales bacterium]